MRSFVAASIDDGAAREVAVFGGVGNRIAHFGDAAFVDQVHDQLHFVAAFEIGHFRRVARFDQRFVSRLNQRGEAAAEHGLLAEEIGFGFFAEIGFDHSGARAADGATTTGRAGNWNGRRMGRPHELHSVVAETVSEFRT